ncbi:RdgB/HAM1 family non-canonical purine NTP pyrophosphatase [Williamsoniiplasma lucivorax]|uniref:dITP/XTP pyrophosphatase n=1 Tax=Williamsoniiplasma lucivorax TaxID=209274 RepID=A0A2S5RDX7_9MOLU|nr:RdgB/HAM1 family non-canonical purine NTP pyrophosphatase [Williamsoniiplasma lucivorax]PPE05521.1 dITP/XTP pyrophosphatase [Williamsoniiplasma lucivorax]
MNKQKIWIATSNQDKVTEFSVFLANYQIKTLNDLPDYQEPEETGLTFVDNAIEKARALSAFVNGVVIADDSGIEIEALNNFPGIYSKRWAYPTTDWVQINQMLIDKINKETDQSNWNAQMVSVIAIVDVKHQIIKTFTGIVPGKISREVKITGNGFGYDLTFIPNGSGLTYSEMGADEKNKYSSRQIASQKLKAYLGGHNEKN